MTEPLDALFRRVAAGDERAFVDLVERTTPPLFVLASRLVGGTTEAEDVLQEAYVSALGAARDAALRDEAHVMAWLGRIVTNAALDALRSRQRERRRRDRFRDEAETSGEVDVEARAALRRLAEWVDALPPEQRIALVLKEIQGMNVAEIAAAQGATEGAVEQRLVRARATLREQRRRHG